MKKTIVQRIERESVNRNSSRVVLIEGVALRISLAEPAPGPKFQIREKVLSEDKIFVFLAIFCILKVLKNNGFLNQLLRGFSRTLVSTWRGDESHYSQRWEPVQRGHNLVEYCQSLAGELGRVAKHLRQRFPKASIPQAAERSALQLLKGEI